MVAIFVDGGELEFTVEEEADVLAEAGEDDALVFGLGAPDDRSFVEFVFELGAEGEDGRGDGAECDREPQSHIATGLHSRKGDGQCKHHPGGQRADEECGWQQAEAISEKCVCTEQSGKCIPHSLVI